MSETGTDSEATAAALAEAKQGIEQLHILRRVASIIAVGFIVFGAGMGWIMNEQRKATEVVALEAAEALELIDSLAGESLPALLTYERLDPFPVESVSRTGVNLSAYPCVLGGPHDEVEIFVTRRMSFANTGGTPPAWAGRTFGYDLPNVPTTLTLDAEGCAPFLDFTVDYPPALAEALAADPTATGDMIIRYRVDAWTTSSEGQRQRLRTATVSSEVFSIPTETESP